MEAVKSATESPGQALRVDVSGNMKFNYFVQALGIVSCLHDRYMYLDQGCFQLRR